MKKMQHGFTLIELVLVIAILGVLAVAALPQLFGVSLDRARSNSMKATASAVQTGLSLYASERLSNGLTVEYPTALDSVAAGTLANGAVPFFTNILQAGVTAQWVKVSDTCYVFDNDGSGAINTGDIYFEYNSTNGSYLQVTTCS